MSPNFSTPYLSTAASAQLDLLPRPEEIVEGALEEAELNQLLKQLLKQIILKFGPHFLKVSS